MSDTLVIVYKKKNYKIFDSKDGFIIYNTKYDFSNHHTHIKNFHTCKYIIDLCLSKTIPEDLSEYLLVSMKRLTEDKTFRNRIQSKIDAKKRIKNRRKRR